MSTSAISMPSRASWVFSRLQNAHHGVVYMVSGCVICRQLPSLLACSLVPSGVTPYHAAGFPRLSARCARMARTRRCAVESPDGVTLAAPAVLAGPAAVPGGLSGPDAVLAALD